MKNPTRSVMWHSLFAVVLIIVGFAISLVQANLQPVGQPASWAGQIILLGVIWFILNRLRLWWYLKKNRNN